MPLSHHWPQRRPRVISSDAGICSVVSSTVSGKTCSRRSLRELYQTHHFWAEVQQKVGNLFKFYSKPQSRQPVHTWAHAWELCTWDHFSTTQVAFLSCLRRSLTCTITNHCCDNRDSQTICCSQVSITWERQHDKITPDMYWCAYTGADFGPMHVRQKFIIRIPCSLLWYSASTVLRNNC